MSYSLLRKKARNISKMMRPGLMKGQGLILLLHSSGHNDSFVLLHTLSPITEDAMKNNYSRVPQPHTSLMCFYSSDILTDCRS